MHRLARGQQLQRLTDDVRGARALAVHPVTDRVSVVGTDGTNEILARTIAQRLFKGDIEL